MLPSAPSKYELHTCQRCEPQCEMENNQLDIACGVYEIYDRRSSIHQHNVEHSLGLLYVAL